MLRDNTKGVQRLFPRTLELMRDSLVSQEAGMLGSPEVGASG